MRRKHYLALLTVAGVLLSSCQESAPAEVSSPKVKNAECSKVETRVRDINAASDPAAYAQERGLTYRNGKVLVVVEMMNADQPLPSGYDFDEQSRQANLIQGFLRTDQLCKLAAENQVSRIRAPAIPQPIR